MLSLLERIAAIEPELIGYRRQIHQHPEPGFEEKETTRLICQVLDEANIPYHSNGDKTGVIATLTGAKPGKVVALRADIDALKQTEQTGLEFSSQVPGVCHACGHDIHTATLMGAARVLSEYRDQLCGTIRFLFQPAEETLGGSRSMIENGALIDPPVDYLLAAHTWPDMPAGSVGVRKGGMLAASDHFVITVRGKSGHAAHPHRCIDPIVIGAHIITELQTIVSRRVAPVDSAVVSIGRLTAGNVSNVIPTEAVMEGTVRTLDAGTRENIRAWMEKMVTLTAEAMGGEAQLDYEYGVPPVSCDSYIVDCVSQAVTELLGPDKLLQVPTPSMGGEDFSFYMEKAPGAFIRLGTADERPESKGALHSPTTVFNEKAIATGVAALVGTAFLLTGTGLDPLK